MALQVWRLAPLASHLPGAGWGGPGGWGCPPTRRAPAPSGSPPPSAPGRSSPAPGRAWRPPCPGGVSSSAPPPCCEPGLPALGWGGCSPRAGLVAAEAQSQVCVQFHCKLVNNQLKQLATKGRCLDIVQVAVVGLPSMMFLLEAGGVGARGERGGERRAPPSRPPSRTLSWPPSSSSCSTSRRQWSWLCVPDPESDLSHPK